MTEGAHQGRGIPTAVGLGFWQAWWMVAMCSDTLLPAPGSLFPASGSAVVMLATALGYVAVMAAGLRGGPLLERDRIWAATGALAFGGTAGMLLAVALGAGGAALAVFAISLALFALGNAMLLFLWGELWATLALGRVTLCLLTSYTFAFLLYFALIALPQPASGVLLAAFPLASLAALRFACQNEPKRSGERTFTMETQLDRQLAVRALTPIVLLSVTWGAVETCYPAFAAQYGATLDGSFLAAGVLMLAMLASTVAFPPEVEPVALYRIITPAVTCGLILLALWPQALTNVGNGLATLGVYALDMLIMLVSTDLAFRARKPVALLYGLGIVTARVTSAAGALAAGALVQAPWWRPELGGKVALAGAVCAVLAGTLLFSQDDLRKLYSTRPVHAPSQTLSARCGNVAQQCGLTAREREVLVLLAHGRSIPYIADELVIAKGTAKHHVANIYRKVGVYDRQSLHDVIEQSG